MLYFKGVLSAIAGLAVALFGPLMVWAIPHANRDKAIGLGVIRGEVLSPIFWALALGFFALFFVASRAGSRVLRILFFWIPTTVAIAFAAPITVLVIYAVLQLRRG